MNQSPNANAVERARKVRVLLFDVDGVLTDGTIWYFPAVDAKQASSSAAPDALAQEIKGFSAHDGIGLVLARRAGLKTGVITKRVSVSLLLRARDLRMDFVRQGVDRKREALEEILRENHWAASQACCMGDDLVDVPMMRACGLAAAPADARPEALQAAQFVAPRGGGRGAARDLVEFVLRAQGVWESVIAEYLRAPEPESVS